MQDFGLAPGIAEVDSPREPGYITLVTKDTSVEPENPGQEPVTEHELSRAGQHDYYAERRAHFIAAVRGLLPISEYVKEVAADVDRRFPPLPQE
jgi:hypothetical protein